MATKKPVNPRFSYKSDRLKPLRAFCQTVRLGSVSRASEALFVSQPAVSQHLKVLRDTLAERGGILGLPLIKNSKTVDPADSSSTPVIQLETAMGAAVEAFEGATAIEVPRSRFLPFKTTNDLLLVRSDVYEVDDDGLLRMVPERACTVNLDPRFYKKIQDFEARFPGGVPSIKDARSLTVDGDWTFGADVVATGEARVEEEGSPGRIVDGTRI